MTGSGNPPPLVAFHFWMRSAGMDPGLHPGGSDQTNTIIGSDLLDCLKRFLQYREPDDGVLVRITRARICRRCHHAECPGCRVWCDQMVKVENPEHTDFLDDWDFCPCIETNCDYGETDG